MEHIKLVIMMPTNGHRSGCKHFFSSFNSQDGKLANLDGLTDIFMPNGVMVKSCGEPPAGFDLSKLGSVAQRLCLYKKLGVLSGERFETQEMKSIQLVNTESGWKISSVAWDDERRGVSIPAPQDKPSITKWASA